jgi:hypothetical protein
MANYKKIDPFATVPELTEDYDNYAEWIHRMKSALVVIGIKKADLDSIQLDVGIASTPGTMLTNKELTHDKRAYACLAIQAKVCYYLIVSVLTDAPTDQPLITLKLIGEAFFIKKAIRPESLVTLLFALQMESEEDFTKFLRRACHERQLLSCLPQIKVNIDDAQFKTIIMEGVKPYHMDVFRNVLANITMQELNGKPSGYDDVVKILEFTWNAHIRDKGISEKMYQANTWIQGKIRDPEKKDCFAWLGKGECLRGDKCRFKHDLAKKGQGKNNMPGASATSNRCHYCGKNGHWSGQCPEKKEAEEKRDKAMEEKLNKLTDHVNYLSERVNTMAVRDQDSDNHNPSYYHMIDTPIGKVQFDDLLKEV